MMRVVIALALVVGCSSSDLGKDGGAPTDAATPAPDILCTPPQVVCNGECLWACNGKCVDLRFDEMNCGRCGRVCDTEGGFQCINKGCKCSSSMTMCDGQCSDIATDPRNCGECGNSCGKDGACSGGTCS